MEKSEEPICFKKKIKVLSLSLIDKCSFCGFSLINFVLLLALVFLMVLTKDILPKKISDEICSNPECVAIAGKMRSAMNEDVHPCDNFYEFVCGKYMDGKIEKLQSASDASIMEDKMLERLLTMLNEKIKITETKTHKTVKTFFQSCMSYRPIEEKGPKYVQEIFDKLGGWPAAVGEKWNNKEKFNWQETQAELLKKGYLETFLVGAAKNEDDDMLKISEPTCLIGGESLQEGMESDDFKNYYRYMIDMAVLFGANYSTAEADMLDVISFEQNITAELDKIDQDMNELPINEFYKKFPFMESYLDKWMENIRPTELKADLERLNVLVENLSKTSNRTLANYLFFRAAHESALYLNAEIRNTRRNAMELFSPPDNFLGNNHRWKWCIQETLKYLPTQTNAIYARKYFPKSLKLKMNEINELISEEIAEKFKKTEYLDEYTRVNALKKLNSTERTLGINDDWFEELKTNQLCDKYKFTLDNFISNKLQAQHNFDQLEDTSDAKTFETVNAYNMQESNKVEIVAGMIQSPIISIDLPDYLNYAGMGGTIGHEMMHSFDTDGVILDKSGAESDWWFEESYEEFEKRVKCMIEQYGNYVHPKYKIRLNGKKTIGENIADNSGTELAYNAYVKKIKKNRQEPKLPGLEKYSNEQMFWMSFARSYCSTEHYSDVYIMKYDEHTVDRFRVIGVAQNSHIFSKDFNCPKEAPMNPTIKCQIW